MPSVPKYLRTMAAPVAPSRLPARVMAKPS
jgi:hypothetical protein